MIQLGGDANRKCVLETKFSLLAIGVFVPRVYYIDPNCRGFDSDALFVARMRSHLFPDSRSEGICYEWFASRAVVACLAWGGRALWIGPRSDSE